ncbi:hypothetical protein H4J58_00765 [Colwellia sp. MB3u-70]|uniref:hypothetical protein n=1 Tax=unclassified Colwellia TaxID=196834 RepID=UPI0015F38F02|nr:MULTISPECIES: hypothetical protein [unclassified Colwellia]MBA6290724.1 hypothetical protein [Colwellia sp. MB3u-8]MBA6305671.1 hypothetical protein [Colwellia sp. MB3u-70]
MQKFNDAIYILDGLAGDLIGSVLLLKETRRNNLLDNTAIQHKHIFRLCFTSVFMNCSKYVEFCDKYGKLLKDEVPELSQLQNKFKEEIKSRGIISFRNDYIGHIHSKKMGRPLSNTETQDKLESCIGGDDSLPFLNWIYPDESDLVSKDNYLVGVIELLHRALQIKL